MSTFTTRADDSDGRLVLYNNGTPVADATGVNGEPCQGNLYLGRHKDTGRIEENSTKVIIYDRALTSVERNFVVKILDRNGRSRGPRSLPLQPRSTTCGDGGRRTLA